MSSFSDLSSHCNNVSTSALNTSNSSLVSLWHNKLGHPSSAVVTHVLRTCNIPCSNKMTEELCTAYCIGKSHRLPSYPSDSVYCAPLELIFCDLWGPAPMLSSMGFNYYVSF